MLYSTLLIRKYIFVLSYKITKGLNLRNKYNKARIHFAILDLPTSAIIKI